MIMIKFGLKQHSVKTKDDTKYLVRNHIPWLNTSSFGGNPLLTEVKERADNQFKAILKHCNITLSQLHEAREKQVSALEKLRANACVKDVAKTSYVEYKDRL